MGGLSHTIVTRSGYYEQAWQDYCVQDKAQLIKYWATRRWNHSAGHGYFFSQPLKTAATAFPNSCLCGPGNDLSSIHSLKGVKLMPYISHNNRYCPN